MIIKTRTQLPVWCKPFIGIPYKLYGRDYDGVDCWGLVFLVARDHFGVELPLYGANKADARELREIDDLVRCETSTTWTRHEVGNAGDIALFKNEHGQLVHVGVVVDHFWMLHCRDVDDAGKRLGRTGLSAPMRYTNSLAGLIEGYYRFAPEDLVA